MLDSTSSTLWRPASANQSRYVLAELAHVGTYMIPLGHRVEGTFRPEAFQTAAKAVVARHDVLRTRFKIMDAAVQASIAPEPFFQYHLVRPKNDHLDAFRDCAIPLIFTDVNPLEEGSLVRIIVADYGDSWRFTIAAHHAITDGFSRGVMNKELLKLYAGEDLPDVRSYYDFAASTPVAHGASDAAQAFVDDLPNPVSLVGDGLGQGRATDQGQVIDYAMGDVSRSVRMLCKSIGATKFGLFSAIYALSAYGFSGSPSVTSFFQTEGRKALGAPNSVVGPFSNTLPLNLEVNLDRDLASFARAASESAKQSISLEHEPGLLDAVLSAGKGPSISINMFPPSGPIRAGDLDVGDREFLDRRTEFDLNMIWAEDRNVLTARAFYDRSHMSHARVMLFLQQQERLLRVALDHPDLTCREVLAKARLDHHAALPQSCVDPKPAHRLHTPFFATAEKTPEAVALRTSKSDISYADLAQDVRRITASLQAAGLQETDTVAIYADRHPDLVAAMLGVSATGAAFALIDAAYPISRCEMMIQDLGARFLIEGGAATPDALAGLIQTVRATASPDAAVIVHGAPRSAACHMFTSGTTGRPKLITHPDTTLLRFVDWQAKTLGVEAPINTIMMAGLAHDPTLRDVFLPLTRGGLVTIPLPCEFRDPKALRGLLETSACNVIRLSPSTAQLLMTGAASDLTLDSVRGIFWGGERLAQVVPRDWSDFAPNARQFQMFGTTETPQAFLAHEITEDSFTTRDIPLGVPLSWTGARLVDEDGNTVAVGEVGEIVAELADPIKGINQKYDVTDTPSACQHFTGDMGYQRSDGSVCLIGRSDNQIKINGFRVELKEIEVAIEQLDAAPQAKALYADERLLVFVKSGADAFTPAGIKAEIARRLPSYMVPAQVLILPAFPMTPNGKVDHPALVALAKQDRDVPHNSDAQAEVVGQVEKDIAAVFAKATGQNRVFRDSTLVDLGADSLSTIEARFALEDLGLDLPDQWEWLPLKSLATHMPGSVQTGQRSGFGMPLQKVDTFLFLRSIAIAMVVLGHTGLPFHLGASLMLIAIAGFSFGRINLPSILKDGRTGRIWALILKLLVPLVPFSLIIYFAHSYFGNDPHIATILLFKNLAKFADGVVLQTTETHHYVVWLWFLHVYLQIYLLLGLAFGMPTLRKAFAVDPWRATLVAFGGAATLSIGLIWALSSMYDVDFGHMAALLQYSPTTILPYFLIGLLFSVADSGPRRTASIVAAVAYFGVSQLTTNAHDEWAWVVALLLCTFVPYTPLPKLLKSVAMLLSVNALMIYLSHRTVHFALQQLTPFDVPLAVDVATQLAVGVLLGMVLSVVVDAMGINRLSQKRISFRINRDVGQRSHSSNT